jgi:hypothetical protein
MDVTTSSICKTHAEVDTCVGQAPLLTAMLQHSAPSTSTKWTSPPPQSATAAHTWLVTRFDNRQTVCSSIPVHSSVIVGTAEEQLVTARRPFTVSIDKTLQHVAFARAD